MENKETIDKWNPIMLEYPFVRKGMTVDEYEAEKEYYGKHLKEVRDGTYLPLWKQKKIKQS